MIFRTVFILQWSFFRPGNDTLLAGARAYLVSPFIFCDEIVSPVKAASFGLTPGQDRGKGLFFPVQHFLQIFQILSCFHVQNTHQDITCQRMPYGTGRPNRWYGGIPVGWKIHMYIATTKLCQKRLWLLSIEEEDHRRKCIVIFLWKLISTMSDE